MRHTDTTPVLVPILLTNPLISDFAQQSLSIELVDIDTYESRDDVPGYFNHELLPFGVKVISTWSKDTFAITGVLEPGNPNHGTSGFSGISSIEISNGLSLLIYAEQNKSTGEILMYHLFPLFCNESLNIYDWTMEIPVSPERFVVSWDQPMCTYVDEHSKYLTITIWPRTIKLLVKDYFYKFGYLKCYAFRTS